MATSVVAEPTNVSPPPSKMQPKRLKQRQMKRTQTPDFFIEPERYELRAAPMYRFKLDRREFFKVLGCGGVVVFLVDVAIAQESGNNSQPGNRSRQRSSDIGSWLHIGEDGTV